MRSCFSPAIFNYTRYIGFIQEILVSDWIIRSAHAQTDCFQMRSPAQNGRTWPCIVFILNPLFTNSVKITKVMNMEINKCGSLR